MKKRINIILIFVLTIGWVHHHYAQVNKLMQAFECYQSKNMTCAKNKIDSVVLHPETKSEPAAWSLKAYIYYYYFKTYETNIYNSKFREQSLQDIKTSLSLSPDPETEQNDKRLLKTIAESYYSQIKIYLYDSLNFNICQKLYDNYKNNLLLLSPGSDFKYKDIEFYLSVGGHYVSVVKQILEGDKADNNARFFNNYIEIAKVCFNKVLELDPNNPSAMEGLAIVYYNQGAKLIKDVPIDTPIDEMDKIQEDAKKYFKQALPYMQKAYQAKPQDRRIIEGLTGIYYGLNETDKYIEFRKKLDEIKKNNPNQE